MNPRGPFKWSLFLVVFLLAAAVAVAAAQGAPDPAPPKAAPVITELGESASPTAILTESEPNNDFASADAIQPGDVIAGKIRPAGDVDTFKFTVSEDGNPDYLFDIDAAVLGSPLDAYVCLYSDLYSLLACNDDSDGWDSLLYRGLYPGDSYYIQVHELRDDEGGAAFTYRLAIYSPLFVSAATAGSVAGVAFRPEDVLAHYDFPDGTEKWLMFFDGSDVGITRNVSGFALYGYPYETILSFAFQANQPIDGLGTVRPNNAVWFRPDNLGSYTAGANWRNLQIDELDAAGEKIDALGRSTNSGIYVSTTGATSVTSRFGYVINARDEDLISGWVYYDVFDSWEYLEFDGSQVPGLAAEDVFAADYNGVWYLTILGSGVIDGHAYNQKDIFMVDSETYEVLGRYWHGPAHHFNYNLDAIDVSD